MSREVRWERMFPDQLEAAFAECPVAYFPYGLCEPHGPQNAVGLDGLKAHAIACAAARVGGGIVAPLDQWHIAELGGMAAWSQKAIGEVPRTWLTALPPWQHFKNVLYHIRMADTLGFHAAILFTGHYGPNWEDLKTLVALVQPHVGTRLCGVPEFESNYLGFDSDGKSGGDHAGRVETSLLWALLPECVDVSRIPSAPGQHFAMGKDAAQADRRVGDRMVEDEVRWLTAKAGELLEEYQRLQPRHTLRTFDQVEQLWDDVVRPKLKEFRTMQTLWGWPGEEAPAEDSVWYPNWQVPERG
jgi:creatinine amidohydrolase/Fe(II)-dependent formamide hydrolase-like protein